MNISLINKIKYSPLLYTCYFHIGNIVISLLKLLVKSNDRRIFFISFGGRKFDDSPKAVYEAMLKDHRFDDYEFIWAFQNPEHHDIPKGRKIKTDTLGYFCKLLSSRIWVTNSSVERGLHFKGKNTFYLNTWHGTPIKMMGIDIADGNTSFKGNGDDSHTDVMLAQGKYEADIFARVFGVPRNRFAIIGLPRNDELIKCNNIANITRLKKKLKIPAHKHVILYAPTFREYEKDDGMNCVMIPPLDLERWSLELGEDYVFLLRAHYEVARVMNVKKSDFVRDVSDYPSLNELMLVSDMLISDYSSIFFDYSILGRPMLPYCYDYPTYSSKRGMYFDIRDALDCHIADEDSLIEEVKSMDKMKRHAIACRFRNHYIDTAGSAAQETANIIAKALRI